MFLKTGKINAATAAKRWKKQYFSHVKGFMDADREAIYNQLVALGPTPNPDDVDSIIGNGSWTNPGECDECKNPNSVLVEVGELPDYESRTVLIRTACLEAALKLVEDAQCDSPAAPPKP